MTASPALSVERYPESNPKRPWISYAVLIAVAILIAFPVLWLVLGSLKTGQEFNAYPMVFLPARPQWVNYLAVTYPPFLNALWRTAFLSLTTAALTCVTSSLAGYAFARFRVYGTRALFSVVMATLIVPTIVLQIPQFLLYARVHLIITYWPWILVALGANPLYIFMFRQFFLTFPKELEEAAEIDGCTPFKTFLRVILPNSMPVMACVFMFAFANVWGDYIAPQMFLNRPDELLGVFFAFPFGSQYPPQFFALVVCYILPVALLFLAVQKNIQKGMLLTGLSGI